MEQSLDHRGISDLRPYVTQLVNSTSLSLKDNHIQHLPSEFALLEKLTTLNLQNNPLDLNQVLPVLSKMQNLQSLFISITGKDDLQRISDELRQVRVINGMSIHQDSPRSNRCYLSAQFLDFTENIFESVNQLYNRHPCASMSATQVEQQFIRRVQSTKKTLLEINQSELDHISAEVNLAKCKYALVQECYNLTLRHMEAYEDKYFSIMCGIHNQYAIMFKDLLTSDFTRGKATAGPRIVDSLERKEPNRAEKELARLRDQINLQEMHMAQLEQENKKYLNMIVKQGLKNNEKGKHSLRSSPSPLKMPISSFSPSKENITLQTKILSKKGVKDIIHEIMAERNKNMEHEDSLQNFMYHFLQKKYGLKKLVLEWAASIAESVKHFRNEDAEIALFSAMLKNQVEEEFGLVQKQLQHTLSELISISRNNFPSPSRQQQLKRTIPKSQLQNIIQYMYNQIDSQKILRTLKDNDRDVSYGQLEETLLRFQLECHIKFLQHFNQLFKDHDRDNDGMLFLGELVRLVKEIDPNMREVGMHTIIDRKKGVRDPLESRISYSQAVSILSKEKGSQGISLLSMLNQQYESS